MRFDEPVFLVFLLAVLLGTSRLPWGLRKLAYLLASYLFYASWRPEYVLLLATSTLVDWFVARGLHRAEGAIRRVLLVISLAVNLGLLFAFKYLDFFIGNLNGLRSPLGWPDWTPPGWTLPVGISFFTFQTLSYTIDVYRRRLQPADSFVDYALYVSFFPQLVAGPIVRAVQFLPQCVEERRATPAQLQWGATLLLLGLFQKSVLADVVFAPIVDKTYAVAAHPGFVGAWLGTLAFSGQIYCDFAGYSTCAIGTALMLGFSLPDNFRAPYAAVGLSEFWRRWHLSLSSWLRDYLYIPLGGNRGGPLRTYVNLGITMLLGGLWHGASWTFVVWGGLHGLGLALERRLRRDRREPLAPLMGFAVAVTTFVFVCFAWVFFRADSFPQALRITAAMVGGAGGLSDLRFSGGEVGSTLAGIVSLLAVHVWLRHRTLEEAVERLSPSARAVGLALMLFAVLAIQGDDRAFIYFRF